jgi:hypothetical protein
MNLPFTRLEFLQVFSVYNESIWPVQIFAAVLGLVAVCLLFWSAEWADRSIATILSILWAITGIGYHWLFFAKINGAAYLFGGLFLAAALIFLVEGTLRNRIGFEAARGLRGWLGLMLVVYSIVVYPALGLAVTHPYPETPLFGVTPCPTTIFTLGLLLSATYPRPLLLIAVPLLWAAIGGSAAFLLDVPQDLVLPVAGLISLIMLIRQRTAAVAQGADEGR